jgi:hypothetical protein
MPLQPQKSALSPNIYTPPLLEKKASKVFSNALYKVGVRSVPPRRRSTTISKLRRVSFSSEHIESDAHHPDYYDRSGVLRGIN